MSKPYLSGGLGGARAAAPATRTIHRQYRVLNGQWTINKDLRSLVVLAALAEGKPDTDQGRRDPENSREEAERFGGLPARAERVTPEMPGPNATAGQVVDGVDEDTESSEPGERDENVHCTDVSREFRSALQRDWIRTGPREEARGEGDQPEQTEQYRDAGNDFSVDPAGLRPRVDLVERGEVVANDTGNNLYQL